MSLASSIGGALIVLVDAGPDRLLRAAARSRVAWLDPKEASAVTDRDAASKANGTLVSVRKHVARVRI